MSYRQKRIEKNRAENPEYREAYDEEAEALAMRMHNMEMKDSDGQAGSTISFEDPKIWIEREINRLRNLDKIE